MTRKKLFSLIVSLLVFAAATANVQVASAGDSVLSAIEKSGKLVLGTSGNMPSMSETRDGKVVGFDIDLARLMASGMGVKLDIKTMPFDKLLPALERGDVDVVISNVTINPERNMRVAFVGPYMTSGKCIVTKKDALARAEAAEDLNASTTRLATLSGSTSAAFAKALLPKASLTLVEDYEKAVTMVNSDTIGGLLTDYPICLSILKSHPDAGFVSLFSLLTYEPVGIALAGSDPLYINWTENFLTRVQGMGLLDELSMRWFGKASLAEADD
ncbi:MAG TPA: ABC transporter substrate-binding protein [Gammaproteobacteria bacterium]|nr:ABC transporter substrate-binding protein [Gammaproteobacteria bacterium]